MSYKYGFYLRHKIAKLLVSGAFVGFCAMGVTAQADVAFEETFDSGLGAFSESGRVYTGSYGVRLRGGTSGTQVTSPSIDASEFTGMSISFDRSTSGLDWGERAIAAISVNGGSFVTFESTRSASGRFSLDLPATVDNASSIVLRFSIDANSFYETYEIDNIVIEGNRGTPCEPGEPGCSVCPDPENPECDVSDVPIVPIATLMDRAAVDGSCSVSIERPFGTDSTFYVPSDPSDPNAQFNVLVWGNGTGGGSTTYQRLLESVASHCIAVAAANTSSSGSGVDMDNALQALRSRHSNVLLPNHRVCTAGHSQGGGGSFNAANRSGVAAECVIPVQPDTRFTVRIQDSLDPHVEVITLWGSSDTLAPASGNRSNVEANSTILTQVETQGESHFAPTSGRGGVIGTLFRMANIAQLSTDSSLSVQNRRAFLGPNTASRISESSREISDFRTNAAAEAVDP